MERNVELIRMLTEAKTPYEYHIFPAGGHGYGMGIKGGSVTRWPELCECWVRDTVELHGDRASS